MKILLNILKLLTGGLLSLFKPTPKKGLGTSHLNDQSVSTQNISHLAGELKSDQNISQLEGQSGSNKGISQEKSPTSNDGDLETGVVPTSSDIDLKTDIVSSEGSPGIASSEGSTAELDDVKGDKRRPKPKRVDVDLVLQTRKFKDKSSPSSKKKLSFKDSLPKISGDINVNVLRCNYPYGYYEADVQVGSSNWGIQPLCVAMWQSVFQGVGLINKTTAPSDIVALTMISFNLNNHGVWVLTHKPLYLVITNSDLRIFYHDLIKQLVENLELNHVYGVESSLQNFRCMIYTHQALKGMKRFYKSRNGAGGSRQFLRALCLDLLNKLNK